MTGMHGDQPPDHERDGANRWWIRRAQHDAETVESLLRSLERVERGPLSVGKLSREYRKLAEQQRGFDPLSRERLYGALVLLALDNRIRIYGDQDDVATRTTFQGRA